VIAGKVLGFIEYLCLAAKEAELAFPDNETPVVNEPLNPWDQF